MRHPQRLFTFFSALLWPMSNVTEHAALPSDEARRPPGALLDCLDFLTKEIVFPILSLDGGDNHEPGDFLPKWQTTASAQASVRCQFHEANSSVRETIAGLNLVLTKSNGGLANIQLGKDAIIYESERSTLHHKEITHILDDQTSLLIIMDTLDQSCNRNLAFTIAKVIAIPSCL